MLVLILAFEEIVQSIQDQITYVLKGAKSNLWKNVNYRNVTHFYTIHFVQLYTESEL